MYQQLSHVSIPVLQRSYRSYCKCGTSVSVYNKNCVMSMCYDCKFKRRQRSAVRSIVKMWKRHHNMI